MREKKLKYTTLLNKTCYENFEYTHEDFVNEEAVVRKCSINLLFSKFSKRNTAQGLQFYNFLRKIV